MKRWLIAALALLLAAAAWAEAAAFTFRNGVEWGMSTAEVLKREGRPPYATGHENGLDVITLSDATHMDAPCQVEYLFFKDSLNMARVVYDVQAAGVSLDGLRDALSALYGAATPLSTDQLSELTLGDKAPDSFYGWVLYDETLVCLAEDRSEGTLSITYADLVDSEG